MLFSWTLLFMLLYVVVAVRETAYYDRLGVETSATARQIKRAYHKLSLKHHPDKGGDAAVFMEITSAYEVLYDTDKRRIYDQHGEAGLDKQNQRGGGGGGDPFDIFESLFGGGGRRGRNQEEIRGDDLKLELLVSLEDLYQGRFLSIEVSHKKLCSHCRGSGAASEQHIHQCSVCGGHGQRIQKVQIAPGMFQQFQQTCDACGGLGKIIKKKCPKCNGDKITNGISELDVYIERGMVNGETIVFQNAHDEHPDHAAGHIVLEIVTLPHARFTRDGTHLRMGLNISLLEALVGFEKEFRHLDGHVFSIKRTLVTIPGMYFLTSY